MKRVIITLTIFLVTVGFVYWIFLKKSVDDKFETVTEAIPSSEQSKKDAATTITAAQRNYERSVIHREFDNDSLLLEFPELRDLVMSFVKKSKKIKEKEYGAGDYFGKYRVYASNFDTLVINKGDGGDYGFDNTLYLKRKDSLVLFRRYKFANAYWAKSDSITEQIVKFKKGSMIFAERRMKGQDWGKLNFGSIKFDTVVDQPKKHYKILKDDLKRLYTMELIE